MLEIFTNLADFVTFGLLGFDEGSRIAEAVHFFVEDTTKILFLIAVLMSVAGFIRTWISPEKTREWLEERPRAIGYLLAVLLGSITPFCCCSSIPLFMAFLGSGIPLGVTMAFLITSPMVNEVAAVLFGEAIGWSFTLAYLGVGMISGIIGGVIIDLLKLDKWVEPDAYGTGMSGACATTTSGTGEQSCCSGCGNCGKTGIAERLRTTLLETGQSLKDIWGYVVIGVGVGAWLHGFVPCEWFIEHAGADNILAVPVSVLVAIPLYSNVTGTIPVADVLISKGLPVGTTLAFIMSMVAISLPEIMILRKVLKPQMLVFFTCYLAISFIVVGYVFNWLF